MTRAKPSSDELLSSDELKRREKLAMEWKLFRRNNLFTQKKLAEVMGVSRRTIQQIEGARVTPHPDTVREFLKLKSKYDLNADIQQGARNG